ncbi:MAG: PTS transporter subunit EIIA [Erysipelotrichaceae bacterium]|nr:PTS transporter subunit EIIA [Erysipelotrichaceae bacterium]
MKLNERMKKLINILYENDGIISGDFLGSNLGVTSRTIRNDIKQINEMSKLIGCQVDSIVGRGYILNIFDIELFEESLESSEKEFTFLEKRLDDELNLIIKNTLSITKNTFQQIIDLLHISDSTFNKDLILLKSKIKNSEVTISKDKNNIVVFEGNETDIRGEIVYILYNNLNLDTLENNQNIIDIFGITKIQNIKNSLEKFIKETNYQLSDELFSLLLLHIAVGLHRPSVEYEPYKDARSKEVYKMIKNSLKSIDYIYKSNLTQDSWFYTNMFLTINNFYNKNIDNKIYSYLERKTIKILEQIQEETNIQFLYDSILINGLVLHLNGLIERKKFNIIFNNQNLNSIKHTYPLAYEIAIIYAKEISNIFNLNIDDNELDLITIHFGGSLERIKSHRVEPKNVVVVCGYGIAIGTLVKERLKNEFGNQFVFKAILNSNEVFNYDLSNIDYIFTTVPLDIPNHNQKIINVDIALTNTNIKDIEYHINYGETYDLLLELLSKDNFYKNVSVETSEEAIKYLASKMVENGSIDEENVQEILKREELSSTEIGNLVAIPHCFNTFSNKSAIGVMTLEKPIVWKKEKVQILFLIVLSSDKKAVWNNVFKLFYPVLTDEKAIKNIINQFNFDELINELLKARKED